MRVTAAARRFVYAVPRRDCRRRRTMPTISKLLLAYDGSAGADAALDDLARAGLPSGLDVIVLAVASDEIPEPAGSPTFVAGGDDAPGPVRIQRRVEDATERARFVAEEFASRVAERFPGWRVSAEACGGSPASAIVLNADVSKPDLVVVGSRGRARPVRALLGSVARKVVTEARCSVRVARPPTSAAGSPARILVGHDGGAGGRAALAAAAARQWPPGSELRVLGVEDLFAYASFGTAAPWTATADSVEASAAFRRAVETDAERVRRAGLAVSAHVELGDPKSYLLEAARRWRADCVFVGAVSRNHRDRFLLGSVSAAVADRARCSVEVVRARGD
jgi:nucleotide-binding universal stress UspA family protein